MSIQQNETPLPGAFIDRIRQQFPQFADSLLLSLDLNPRHSVHIHPIKGHGLFADQTTVPWHPGGRILNERPIYTLDPHYHAGAYYPQESSSMFIHWLTEQSFGSNNSIRVLDLCASPGGKSLLLLSWLGQQGTLISNEVHPHRNIILAENLKRWGIPKFIITRNEASDFSGSKLTFDLVLVDAPCSGEGLFRKDTSSRSEWSPGNVESCAIRQEKILRDILPCVREGGYLIYSTCTFSAEENEVQCERLGNDPDFEPVFFPIPPEFPVEIVHGQSFRGYRFLPHRVPGEGFFACVFRKKGNNKVGDSFSKKQKEYWTRPSTAQIPILASWNISELSMVKDNKEVVRSPLSPHELNAISTQLRVTHPGITLGQIAHGEFIPDHGLAMIAEGVGQTHDIHLSLEESLHYLRGDAPGSLSGSPGWYKVGYENSVLGWVKILQGRTNNYYPKEWRIRMKF